MRKDQVNGLISAAVSDAIGRAHVLANACGDEQLAAEVFEALMDNILDEAAAVIGNVIRRAEDPDATRDDFIDQLDQAIDGDND